MTKQENGTWTFAMPRANVQVEASYTKNLQDAWIQAIVDQTYTGEAITPTVVVKDGETTLTLGTDYTVAYENNVETGTAATMTVTAVAGSDYSGTASTTFTITAKTTTDGNVTLVDGGAGNRELTIQDMGNQQGKTVEPGLEVSTLNYTRTLNASDEEAYTVCLPYAPKTDGGLKYYTLSSAEGTTLEFTKISGTPQVNTPYLVFAPAMENTDEAFRALALMLNAQAIVTTYAPEASTLNYIYTELINSLQGPSMQAAYEFTTARLASDSNSLLVSPCHRGTFY